jgi:hypothetical protein
MDNCNMCLSWFTSRDEKKKVGHQLKNMLLECQFNGRKCDKKRVVRTNKSVDIKISALKIKILENQIMLKFSKQYSQKA